MATIEAEAQPDLEELAAQEPEAVRAIAERVEHEATREWLLGYIDGEGGGRDV